MKKIYAKAFSVNAALLCKLLTLALFVFFTSQVSATVRYVKAGASGNGSSWATASGDIQAMINTSTSGDEVWVAGGTYLPNRTADALTVIATANRNNSFVLKSGVKVFGGFLGNETLFSARDLTVVANKSTLTGDFNGNDAGYFGNNSENANHVVVSAGAVGTATLDGFTIKGGNANGTAILTVNAKQDTSYYGGGIMVIASSPTFSNLVIISNSGNSGGGVYCTAASSPIFSNVTINNNRAAGQGGGGMFNMFSSPILSNVVVNFNGGNYLGGGICNFSSSPSLTNVKTNYDTASLGGGIYNVSSSFTLNSDTIIGNKSSQGGGLFNDSLSIITLNNVAVTGNASGPGGGIYNNAAVCTIINSSVTGNTSGGAPGSGIFNGTSSSSLKSSILSLKNVTIANNIGSSGAGLYNNNIALCTIANCTISNNNSNSSFGAGVYQNSSLLLRITNTTISGNTTSYGAGGGIYNNGPLSLLNDTIINNSANVGGGIMNTHAPTTLYDSITNVIISGNSATGGGGIYNAGNLLVITNTLISGNAATSTGGGGMFNTYNYGNPIAIPAILTNVTIAGNTAAGNGGGIYNYNNVTNLLIRNSIIYGNSTGIVNSNSTPNISYSLVQGATDVSNGNIGTTDPLFTNALAAGLSTGGNYNLTACSPVLGLGNIAYFAAGQAPDLSAITTDLAGNPRLLNGGIDLGALERQSTSSTTPNAAGVVFVKAGANGLGLSWACATGDIQAAINAVGVKQVWVAKGTYLPIRRADNGTVVFNNRNNAFVLKTDVSVYGGFVGTETTLASRDLTLAANASILSGDFSGDDGTAFANNTENAYHVVISAGDVDTATLDGFTITGGNANAIVNGINNIIVNGQTISQFKGGGIGLESSSPTFANIKVNGNVANYGGGISCYSSSPNITNSIIGGNKVTGAGGGIIISSSSPTLTNLLVSGNTSTGDGGGLYNEFGSLPIYTNLTIASNTAGGNGGGIYSNVNAGPFDIRNSIVYGNNSGLYTNAGSFAPNTFYSLVQGLTSTSNGNINGTTNPLFNAPLTAGLNTGGDYSLQLCSPANNGGSNSYFASGQSPDLSSINTDLAGNTRFYTSGKIDMGAYETALVSMRYVKATASGTGDGTSWANASNDLQAMINASCTGNQIWVAAGTYKPNRKANATATITLNDRNNAFVLKADVKIYGGFAGMETTLAARNLAILADSSVLSGDFNADDNGSANIGEDAYHVVISAGNVGTAALDGFIITGGNGSGSSTNLTINGQSVVSYNGGGMAIYASAPTLNNLIIKGNSANYGGGIYNNNNASPTITNTVISGNLATYGGGIANESGASFILTNTTISANLGYNTSGAGGIYSTSSSTQLNIRNSIIYGNITGSSTSSGIRATNTFIQNSLVQDSTSIANGNISTTDPLFVNPVAAGQNTGGNYRLQPCSPANNAGSNALFAAGQTPDLSANTTDLAGNPRFFNSMLDMGAYEIITTTVRYVKTTATGTGDGTSWTNASGDLQAVINGACNGTQIWVKGGTYKPIRRADVLGTTNTTKDRNNAFVLKNGVKIYGGFAGNEATLAARNLTITANASVLSGDLNGNDGANFANNGENAYHVVIVTKDVNTMLLDGFTISGGNANNSIGNGVVTLTLNNGISIDQGSGGGIYVDSSSSVFNNLKVTSNAAIFNGGGIINYFYSAVFTNVTITNNKATTFNGGGMYNLYSSPIITNVIISGNTATAYGGGMYNITSSPIIANVVISGNSSANNTGGMYNFGGSVVTLTNSTIASNSGFGITNAFSSSATLRNCIVYGNGSGITNATATLLYSLVQDSLRTVNGNISGSTNPLFTAPLSAGLNVGGDYTLSACSPVKDYGNNAYFAAGQTPDLSAITTDLADNARIINNTVDMGAYENASTYVPSIRYVKAGATGSGCSWGTASGDIQAMINASVAGNQIWVAGGTYKPTHYIGDYSIVSTNNRENTFILKNSVQVYGGFAGTETALAQRDLTLTANASILSGDLDNNDGTFPANNAQNAVHVVMAAGDLGTAALDGFTVKGGNANSTSSITVPLNGVNTIPSVGGGIYIQGSSASFSNLIITGNYGSEAGGIFISDAGTSPTILNTIISGNQATFGGGMYVYQASPIVTNVKIVGNYLLAGGSGGGICNDHSSATYTNVLISGNAATSASGAGGMRNVGNSDIFTNVTIAANYAKFGAAMTNQSTNMVFRNCLIYGNPSPGYGAIYTFNNNTDIPVFNFSLAEGVTVKDNLGNIDGTTDPLFAAPLTAGLNTGGDYRLQPCSPVINKGSNAFYSSDSLPNISAINFDITDSTRFYGNADMGAYERQTSPTITPNASGIIFVTQNGGGSGNSWTCPAELQAAINGAVSGNKIFVTGGTYIPIRRADATSTITLNDRNNAFVLKNGVKIYGGFAGTETTLANRNLALTANASVLSGDLSGNDGAGFINNAENAYHVVMSAGNSATDTLDGFTIRGGNTTGFAGVTVNGLYIDFFGGGIACKGSSPTLNNLVIKENYGLYGGGLGGQQSSPIITNTVFTGDSAKYGGAMYLSSVSSPIITNTLITGNKATDNGGAMFVEFSSLATLTNVTISSNVTTASGADNIFLNGGSLKIRNSIIYGNDKSFAANANPDMQFSLAQGLTATTLGNISGTIDPLFTTMPTPKLGAIGNYNLQACSPAINAGNINCFAAAQTPNLVADTFDVAGNKRIFSYRPDMGAYESQTIQAGGMAVTGDVSTVSIQAAAMNTLTATASSCRTIAAVLPTGTTNALTGNVSTNVWVETSQPANYVKRHYQITPATNAATATGTVTLYFTQQEFTDFNAANAIKLPIDATDAANNKANLLIEKHSGSSSNGSGLPNTYPTGTAPINIAPTAVVWNGTASRWEVTFNTTGFSGFFAKTQSTILPVTLVAFSASLTNNKTTTVQWNVVEQISIKNYVVERSTDGNNFNDIGSVAANSLSSTSYIYTDVSLPAVSTVFYRLKIVGIDGTTTYSQIVSVKLGESNLITIYPNPAKDFVWLQGGTPNLIGSNLLLTDMQGRVISSTCIGQLPMLLNTSGLSAGIYLIRLDGNQTFKVVIER